MIQHTEPKGISLQKRFLKSTGKNIRTWRIIKEIKLDQLAKMIGISKGGLSLIENGKTNTSLSRVVDISFALEISEKQLLFVDPCVCLRVKN